MHFLPDSQPPPPVENFADNLTDGLERRDTGGSLDQTIPADGRIQAFAKLEFDRFDIYIQKLSVVLGRRPASAWSRKASMASQDLDGLGSQPPLVKQEESAFTLPADPPLVSPGACTSAIDKGKAKVEDESFAEFIRSSPPPLETAPAPALEPQPMRTEIQAQTATPEPIASTSKLSPVPDPLPAAQSTTDIDLGPRRAISRQHARLYYDHEVGGWILEVLGRNGVVIEGHWRAKGQKTLLLEKTKLQIADRIFHFLLPTIDVYRAEGGTLTKGKQIPRPRSTDGRSKSNKISKGKGKGSGKGKGKGKTKVTVEAGDSSSLSEVSDSENDVSPLQAPSVDLAGTPIDPSIAQTPTPTECVMSPMATPAVPEQPDASTSLPPLPSRSTSLPSSTSASQRPSRSPLPRQASLRAHSAMAPPPRAASRNAVYTEAPATTSSSRAPVPPSAGPTEEELELGRQRAAMIAQLLSGQAVGGKSPSAVSQATGRRAGMRSGKGKSTESRPPPPGKGPGKGKGPPPRPALDTDAGWRDGDDSDSDDSNNDSDEDVDMEQDTKPLIRKTPMKGQSYRATSPGPSTLAPAPEPTIAPMAMKQPKRRASNHAASASPAPSANSTLTSASLPPLPSNMASLPSIPTPSPRSLSASILPDLGTLQAIENAATMPIPTTVSASTTALPLAPPSAFASQTAQPSKAASKVPKKSKAKSGKGVGDSTGKKTKAIAPDDVSIALDAANLLVVDSANPTLEPSKPRPSPYMPASHPPGTPLPLRAPADDLLAKPPYTYASLIAQAVTESDLKKLTMQQIYEWIVSRWPYFKDYQTGWQNSIRHNLTPARGFLKVLRRPDEAGKGAFWMIDPAQAASFDGFHFRRNPSSNSKSTSAAAKSAASGSPATAGAPSPADPSAAGSTKAAKPSKSKANANAVSASSPAPTPSSAAAATASSSASSSKEALSKPLPIVVGPIPDSYVRPAPPKTAADNSHDEVTAALLADPPIVLHEGKIILNPGIFAHLTQEQLDNFQAIPASKALQILQAFVVQYFKDKMRRAAAEKARAAKAAAKAAGAAGGQESATSAVRATPPSPAAASDSNSPSAASIIVTDASASLSQASAANTPAGASAPSKKRARESDPLGAAAPRLKSAK
ncbi:uncharacterized protein JCM15063_004990 [Sporobolomyces koalae]|uniref:uncharacterized protein n=1 Tax=Sporobolomyces koalae TaxID=500713 RepID=UPI003178D44D